MIEYFVLLACKCNSGGFKNSFTIISNLSGLGLNYRRFIRFLKRKEVLSIAIKKKANLDLPRKRASKFASNTHITIYSLYTTKFLSYNIYPFNSSLGAGKSSFSTTAVSAIMF